MRGLLGRLRGLMFRRDCPPGSALILPSCKQIHTYLVRFPIDVAYSAEDRRVIRVDEDVRPSSLCPRCADAAYVIEFPAGTIRRCGIEAGDILVLEEGAE